jgi:cytochrome oxidase Cu insertion factor (SCO1/SenC/PrrC family)
MGSVGELPRPWVASSIGRVCRSESALAAAAFRRPRRSVRVDARWHSSPVIRPPDFTLPDQHGDPVSLSGLRGQNVVVYFYPKADT